MWKVFDNKHQPRNESDWRTDGRTQRSTTYIDWLQAAGWRLEAAGGCSRRTTTYYRLLLVQRRQQLLLLRLLPPKRRFLLQPTTVRAAQAPLFDCYVTHTERDDRRKRAAFSPKAAAASSPLQSGHFAPDAQTIRRIRSPPSVYRHPHIRTYIHFVRESRFFSQS